MKILHTVEYYSPSVGGAQEVVRQISERLARRGHAVTVATSRIAGRPRRLGGVAIEEFAIRGNAVRGFDGDTGAYREFLRSGDFDLMLNYAAQQWATDLALPILEELPFAKILAPCGFSALFHDEYAAYFGELRAALAFYDRVLVHSDTYRDARFVASCSDVPVEVVPNGAGAEEFERLSAGGFRRRHRIPAGVPLLLTVGSHSGMKGHRAVLEAFARARIGRAVLVLVGNTGSHPGCLPECRRLARRIAVGSLGRKRILLLDPPREGVLEAYAAADLFVFASRIECSPLVLFEAAASGTPFLTVPVGNSEEIAGWTGAGIVVSASTDAQGLVEADPDRLARSIEELWADTPRRAALGAAGRRAWEERFGWEQLAERYEALYAAVSSGRRPAGSDRRP